ncbi:hypothetical protein, partial [Azospirillum tabaci]|uniref:hypothetical protein n=1 Tax=Azospirillum tabaci TaxID=2752310 RepID=UPI001B3B6DB5
MGDRDGKIAHFPQILNGPVCDQWFIVTLAFRKKCGAMKKALAGLGRAAYNPAPTTPGPLRSATAARERQR